MTLRSSFCSSLSLAGEMEGVGGWAVIVAAREVTRVWERLQSARVALECYPDDRVLLQTCLNLETDLAVAISQLSSFFGDDQSDVSRGTTLDPEASD